ncbi:MAG TPA: radical SAM protein [Candidatus Hydrogenedentes bacterium]|nr:radical SAM protein [Candidatus Hydrogenedentota bacterium]
MSKKLRVFLANLGRHTRTFPLVTPPVGLLALAAYLREKLPVDVQIVNQRLENCEVDEVIRRARDFNADVVGFSCFTTSSHYLPDAVDQAREALPNALIMVGGPHASSAKAHVLKECNAHVVVPGEGELTVTAVLQRYLDGTRAFDDIPGLIWRNDSGEITINPGLIPQIDDLDSLPMPAWDLIDLPAYWKKQSIAPVYRRRYASLVSSRGCPYQCIWCHKIFRKAIRTHSPQRVADEIEWLMKTYRINDFEFLDDNFNFYPKRVLELHDEIKKRGLMTRICFPTGLRSDLLTHEVIDALVDLGMFQASFALETASPRLQKYTCKNLNIAKLMEAGSYASSKRVYCNIFCMLGFPTETEEEIRLTIDTACASPFHTASFYTVTPFPGTPLYDIVAQTHPEKLSRLRYNDMDFSGMQVNLTDLPDEKLFGYQRQAMRKFYSSPRRIWRLLRAHPQPWMLPAYVPIFTYRATKGLFSKSPIHSPHGVKEPQETN